MIRTLDTRPDLATPRLALRRPAEHDVAAIVSIVGDWEVARRLARVPHPCGPDDARFFLERVVPAEWVWAITLGDEDRLIGAVGLTPEEGTAELGYWLAPAHWGQGIATEAARAVVDFGLEHLGLARLTSGYFEENPASGRVLAKLGFVETGRVMRPCVAVGGDVPSVRMILEP
ncbi:GNAT family N-acetyltransferase [Sphingomonas pseudosanguinis]|uniref:GNAT family N-acetyltransferase n=1 Tax=Sphingomonas pseudosanguinis TaxID=413712 RepID=UPI003F86E4FF